MNQIRKEKKRVQKKDEQRKGLASFVSMINQKEIFVGVGALILVSVIALLAFGLMVDDPIEIIEEVIEVEEPRHPLTGEVIEEDYEELPQVFGVMVENSADSWPLVGLDEAFLVIEAPVEAGIPRFISFYSEESDVQEVGPVRSARPYYLDWNAGLQAIYAHVGGSPEALELIEELDVLDLNEYWYGGIYFYRDEVARVAPHNTYTDSEMLVAALEEEFDIDEPSYDLWQFADDAPVESGKSITIDWVDGTLYDIDWEYQEETNSYLRYQGGGVFTMADGATINANNIVVMATDMRVIDNELRRSIVTVGSGDALIVQNGEVYLGRWTKSSHDERIMFTTSDGYEISFNAGNTWIEVVSSLSQVEID